MIPPYYVQTSATFPIIIVRRDESGRSVRVGVPVERLDSGDIVSSCSLQACTTLPLKTPCSLLYADRNAPVVLFWKI